MDRSAAEELEESLLVAATSFPIGPKIDRDVAATLSDPGR
jgi:hypothetical protein